MWVSTPAAQPARQPRSGVAPLHLALSGRAPRARAVIFTIVIVDIFSFP